MNDFSSEYLHGPVAPGSRLGLETVTQLLDLLGNPQERVPCVHVAGTNGKGSCCKMFEEILRAAGYKTGLTISPYVQTYRERIQIDGEPVSEEEWNELNDAVAAAARKMQTAPTEFEFVTAMAFLSFARNRCDIAVLETGLGGRLDATNAVRKPLVTVVTSISKDHTAILGESTAQIAFEKAGIFKPGVSAVLYPRLPREAEEVLLREARKKGCPVRVPDAGAAKPLPARPAENRFSYRGEEYEAGMPGEHQILNALTVLEGVQVLREAGMALPAEAVKAGMARARMPARAEILCKTPLILLDGAHNEGGAEALARLLEGYGLRGRATVILGMLADKDVDRVLTILAPFARKLITLTPPGPRAMSAEESARRAAGKVADVRPAADMAEALALYRRDGAEDPLLVCGSLYLASAVRPELMRFAKELENRS